MVSVIFAVLEVSFWAIITVVKLLWKFVTLIMGRSNPWGDLDQMWRVGRYGGLNHVCNISWLSVNGCVCGERGKFAFSHWLDVSSLQHWSHYCVTVWWLQRQLLRSFAGTLSPRVTLCEACNVCQMSRCATRIIKLSITSLWMTSLCFCHVTERSACWRLSIHKYM